MGTGVPIFARPLDPNFTGAANAETLRSTQSIQERTLIRPLRGHLPP